MSLVLWGSGWAGASWDWLAIDATQALSVARHLRAGDGISTGIVYYEEQYRTRHVPAPQTVFPPGYPAVIALVSGLGPSLRTSALIVTLTCFSVIPVLLFWSGRRLGLTALTALVLAAGWSACVHAWVNTWSLLSEMPFIAGTLLSLAWLADDPPGGPRRSPGDSPGDVVSPSDGVSTAARQYLLSGAAAACAFSMRYAGLFWILSVGLWLLVEWWIGRVRLRQALSFALVPAVAVAALLLRNLVIIQEATGGNPLTRPAQPSGGLYQSYIALSELTGLSGVGLRAGGVAEWLFVASAGGLFTWLLLWPRGRTVLRESLRGSGMSARLLCWLYVAVSLGLFIYLHPRAPVQLDARKLLPLVPFALLLLGRPLETIAGLRGRAGLVGRAAGGALVVSLLLGQVNVWEWSTPHRLLVRTVAEALDAPGATRVCLRDAVRAAVPPDRPLLTNEAHYVGELLEQTVLGLPEPRYSRRNWCVREVARLVDEFDVQHVLLVSQSLTMSVFRPPFFESLRSGHVPLWLEPIAQLPGGTLYRVRTDELEEAVRGSQRASVGTESP
jgi:hypothetical protein